MAHNLSALIWDLRAREKEAAALARQVGLDADETGDMSSEEERLDVAIRDLNERVIASMQAAKTERVFFCPISQWSGWLYELRACPAAAFGAYLFVAPCLHLPLAIASGRDPLVSEPAAIDRDLED